MSNILELTPYWEEKVWGGHKLEQMKGLQGSDTLWGESFEVSVLSQKQSQVEGQELASLIDIEKLPYLVKFLDTSADLSIQVHPGDHYAREFEGTSGKTECWIILNAEEGAGLYLGFKPGVEKDDFRRQVEAGEDISQALNFIPVKRGDFYYIPAGTIHAIGKGVTLLEIQQSSGITYRVWDWNRLGLDGKPRELHVNKSFDVLDFSDDFQNHLEAKQLIDIFSERTLTLLETEQFSIRQFHLKEGELLPVRSNPYGRYSSLIIIEGGVQSLDRTLRCCHSYLIVEGGAELKALTETLFILVE